MIRLILALFALSTPAAALAANDVALTSAMFVERAVPRSGGKVKVTLEQPKSVPPGAKLVFVLSYRNQGKTPATNFTVTNPIPAGVAFDSTADAGASYSVDGGKSWGSLGTLRVSTAGASRAALPEDVTHVRWILKAPIAIGGTGKLSFRGSVK
ncbi:hypothetical protein [Sphingomonas sp.]|uniref:hypothetical protein n=1 Tax=Sphingomonas sp. TaxID=28214 RepID=UPI0025FE1C21|nr:hypothetical protein [Sphingomonas sp.]